MNIEDFKEIDPRVIKKVKAQTFIGNLVTVIIGLLLIDYIFIGYLPIEVSIFTAGAFLMHVIMTNIGMSGYAEYYDITHKINMNKINN